MPCETTSNCGVSDENNLCLCDDGVSDPKFYDKNSPPIHAHAPRYASIYSDSTYTLQTTNQLYWQYVTSSLWVFTVIELLLAVLSSFQLAFSFLSMVSIYGIQVCWFRVIASFSPTRPTDACNEPLYYWSTVDSGRYYTVEITNR